MGCLGGALGQFFRAHNPCAVLCFKWPSTDTCTFIQATVF